MAQAPNHFKIARQSMLDSQIHPMGVTSEKLLAAFGDVPREDFVPEGMQRICYCDEDIQITKEGASERYLMEPSVVARMIQAAKPKPHEVALTIGSGIGYHAAILSSLVSTVIALEEDQSLIDQAQAVWDKHAYCNIVGVKGVLNKGNPKHAPFDLIIINGAVADVPLEIKQQLNIGGRLIAPVKVKDQVVTKVTLVERVQEYVFSQTVLFDSGTPYLEGFQPVEEFVF